MGSPKEPTAQQFDALRAAGNLQTLGDPQQVQASNGAAEIKFPLPRQGVSLLVLTW
jgi:xylan 1,4-beta-xylosidase